MGSLWGCVGDLADCVRVDRLLGGWVSCMSE